jgi:hypothetical protein
MPSDFSLYRKIQVVLDVAKAVRVTSWTDLRREIIAQRPPNFVTKQYDQKRDAFLPDISTRSVRRAVSICRSLQLLDDSGQLTEPGRRALRASIFDRVLAEQVHGFLKQEGLHVSALNNIITKSLRANPLIMPTSAELWQKCGAEIPLLLFSQMLALLAHCGSADSSQRKIYLHFNE